MGNWFIDMGQESQRRLERQSGEIYYNATHGQWTTPGIEQGYANTEAWMAGTKTAVHSGESLPYEKDANAYTTQPTSVKTEEELENDSVQQNSGFGIDTSTFMMMMMMMMVMNR
jgi:hypothetical protein